MLYLYIKEKSGIARLLVFIILYNVSIALSIGIVAKFTVYLLYNLYKGEPIMTSEAKKRANKKYSEKTYKNFQAHIKISDWEMIDSYCAENDISKASLLVKAIKYCIDNNIDLK